MKATRKQDGSIEYEGSPEEIREATRQTNPRSEPISNMPHQPYRLPICTCNTLVTCRMHSLSWIEASRWT